MNKKIIVAAACGALLSGVVCAEDLKFYVGADAGYNKHKYAFSSSSLVEDINDGAGFATGVNVSLKSKVPSLGVFAGLRYCENFGAELGYTFYKKAKSSASLNDVVAGVPVNGTYNAPIKVKNIYADLLGYMPISNGFELIGAVGVGQARVKINPSFTITVAGAPLPVPAMESYKTNKIGFRLGLGGQYKFDDNFAVRAMVRYQQVGKKSGVKLIKNMTSLNLGLAYTF